MNESKPSRSILRKAAPPMDKPNGNGYLVLTVKEDTIVTIGEEIKLRVFKERGNLRIAINAPRNLSIQRTLSEKQVQE